MSRFLVLILFAIAFSRVVLPAFGGDTIIPLCPFPIGESRSTIRIATGAPVSSSEIRSFGKIGVRSSNGFRFAATDGSIPFT